MTSNYYKILRDRQTDTEPAMVTVDILFFDDTNSASQARAFRRAAQLARMFPTGRVVAFTKPVREELLGSSVQVVGGDAPMTGRVVEWLH